MASSRRQWSPELPEKGGAVCAHSPGLTSVAVLRNGGGVWAADYQGRPLVQIDDNPATVGVVIVGATWGSGQNYRVYIWHNNGRLFRYLGSPFWWQMIGDIGTVRIGADTVAVGSKYLFVIGNDARHKIKYFHVQTGQFAGTADDNPNTWRITAGGIGFYQMHTNRHVWKWNGGFRNWTKIDQYPWSEQIVAGQDNMYQRHWRPNRVHIGNGNGWWCQIDYGRPTAELAVPDYGTSVYQRVGSTGYVYVHSSVPDACNNNWSWVAGNAKRIFAQVGNPIAP